MKVISKKSLLAFLLAWSQILISYATKWDMIKTPLKWTVNGADIILKDQLNIKEMSWPVTLLEYSVDFSENPVAQKELILIDMDSKKSIPFQLKDIYTEKGKLKSATLCFFSDLPSGGKRHFELQKTSSGKNKNNAAPTMVTTGKETITIDNGLIRLEIPGKGIHGELLSPIIQIGNKTSWLGTSVISDLTGFLNMEAEEISVGELFAEYLISYYFKKEKQFQLRIKVVSGQEFVILEENMIGFCEADSLAWQIRWNNFEPVYRYCNNRPDEQHLIDRSKTGYDNFRWEPITGYPDNPAATYHPDFPHEQHNLQDGLLPFNLQPYHSEGFWWRLHTGAFWDNKTATTIGLFIYNFENWIDPAYPIYGSRNNLAVSYYYLDNKFWWSLPLVTGKRSLGVAIYPHQKDIDRVNQTPVSNFPFRTVLPIIHTDDLRRWYGWISLNKVKNWILDYEPGIPAAPDCFGPFVKNKSSYQGIYSMLEERIINVRYKTERLIGAKLPLQVARPFYDIFYAFAEAELTEPQYRQLRAMFLFLTYLNMDEAIQPMKTLLSGHPDFFSDVKGIPGLAAFLFPDHPYAKEMADHFEKAVALNLRYHVRPDVPLWDTKGGRWTENLACYTFASLRATTRVSFLLHQYYDGRNRLLQPNISLLSNWLLNAFTSPLDIYGGQRAYPPQGAHHAWDIPPGSLYLMGEEMRYYDPMLAEHLLWLSPSNKPTLESDWNNPFEMLIKSQRLNTGGTKPNLKSEKFTGYGCTLRSNFGKAEEMYVFLQQIDEGLNARWGQAAKGGNGIIYYYANGKRYSHNEGLEDVGDVAYGDVERCTNFGVKKDEKCYRCIGDYRSVGRNDLTDPLYDFGFAQFASVSANSEAAPEYKSRSVLMSGNDYILVFDDVRDNSIEGRFSWFAGEKDSFPYIHQLIPGVEPVYNNQAVTYPGDLNLGIMSLNGRYYDGNGDFLTLVTHKEDVNVSLKKSVCDVKRGDASDLVFRGDRNIMYNQSGKIFEGTAGIIRFNETSDEYESALFIGEKIGIPGITVQWLKKPEYGGLSLKNSTPGYQGFIQVTTPASLQFILDAKPGKDFVFYLNGTPVPVEISNMNEFTIKVDKGKHFWQWTNTGVIPSVPVIKNTYTADTWTNVEWCPVTGANGYDLQVSTDGENTWLDVAHGIEDTRYKITGLTDGKKVHIRVIARGKGGQSQPSSSYPVYPSSSLPHAPDGLLAVKDGVKVNLNWGQILGANRYTLYHRKKGSSVFKEVYSGEENSAIVTLKDTSTIWEFCVTATNGIGESSKSVISDTDESSIINWYPVRGETYRRVTESYEMGYPIWNNQIEQALPVLEYPLINNK